VRGRGRGGEWEGREGEGRRGKAREGTNLPFPNPGSAADYMANTVAYGITAQHRQQQLHYITTLRWSK